MKALKTKIDKRLKTIRSADLKIFMKELEGEVKYLNKGLAASVMYRNVEATQAEREELLDFLEADKQLDFTKMPFDDLFFTVPLILGEADAKAEDQELVEEGMLMRFTKGKHVENVIFLSCYIYSKNMDAYISTSFQVIVTDNMGFETAGGLKAWCDQFKNLKDGQTEAEARAKATVKEAIHALTVLRNIMKFETVKTEAKLTSSESRHVPRGLTDKYIEYTLDLSKPTRKRLFKSIRKGGTHDSPCEHRRRGHERVLKSGKTCWVKGSIVNEGSKTGRVEKDYSLGATA